MLRQLHTLTWACGLAAVSGLVGLPQLEAQTAQPAPRATVQQIDPAQLERLQAFQQLQVVRPSQTDPELAVIDWEAARADRQRQLAAYRETLGQSATAARRPTPFAAPLSERSLARLRPVHVPVLLPQTDAEVLTRDGGQPGVMLITRADFYDASMSLDGMSVHVGGNRRINHRRADPGMATVLNQGRGAGGVRISRDEAGYTADFTRYGASYTVSIECSSRTDPRCADEAAVRALVDSLVVAGGNPEG